MHEDALRKIALAVRNWGTWRPDDELGTLNYITPERIAAACRLATTGKVFALGIPLGRNGPQSGTRQRFNRHAAAVRDPVGQPGPHLLRGEDVQRLRCGAGHINPYALK